MLGPLPRLYQVLVAASVVLAGVVAGVLLTRSPMAPHVLIAGVAWGLAAGVAICYLLLHDFQHRFPHRARATRTRRH